VPVGFQNDNKNNDDVGCDVGGGGGVKEQYYLYNSDISHVILSVLYTH
jgi:hypothetical protein